MIINPYRFGVSGPTDPNWANVSSLLHFNGSNGSTTFTDQKGKVWTPSGNAQISTAQSVYGGASGLFDGTGDYVQTPSHIDFKFGTGDFTLEFWLKTSDTSGNVASVINAEAGAWALVIVANTIYWQTTYSVTNLFNTSAATLTDNAWHHVVVQRTSGTTVLGWDGVSKVSASDTTNYNPAAGVIRICSGANGDLACNMDDFRVTKGVARYTFPFTPPTAQFPDS